MGLLCLSAAGLAGCRPGAPAAPAEGPSRPSHRAAAEKPEAAIVAPDVRFVDITREAGLTFTHTSGAAGEKLLPETMGSGAAFFDFDGDGDQDLFLANSTRWPGSAGEPPTQALYRNDGRGRFEDVTEAAGLAKSLYGMGVAVGDYDNDGDPDLYVTAVGGGQLFRNDGGTFADVTAETNAAASNGWLTSACFFDMENDGDLDLFVCAYVEWSPGFDRGQRFRLVGEGDTRAYGPPTAFGGAPCVLLRNDGGTFADVSEASGVQVRTPGRKLPVGKSLGVAPQDLDGDGLVDLAVANDTVPNFLFHNLGGGKFEEVGITSGIAFDGAGSARGAMGIDWADVRNDGTLGLAIGNFANEMTALYVADEPGGLQFTDMANLYGLGAPTQPPLKFGLFFFDYDLDGRLDLLTVNGHLEPDIARVQPDQSHAQSAQLFRNTGRVGRTLFAQVGPESAGPDLFRPAVGRGSTYADIDGDGDLDVLLTVNDGSPRLLRNDGGDRNRWLRLHLTGNPSNRFAIGARVTVQSSGLAQRRQLFPARGYLSSVELPLTFGLAGSEKADEVTITWPSGKTTVLRDLAAGKVHIVDEGGGIRSLDGLD